MSYRYRYNDHIVWAIIYITFAFKCHKTLRGFKITNKNVNRNTGPTTLECVNKAFYASDSGPLELSATCIL